MTITLPRSLADAAGHPVIRALSAVTLVNTLGNGLLMTTGALLFTRVVGMTASQVGLALALGGVCGILAGIPLGRVADRFGARPTVVALLAVEAVLVLGYTQVHSFWTALPLICAVMFVDRGESAVRGALIAKALPPDQRVKGRAFLRSVTNVGISLGAVLASLALVADTPAAYRTVVVADAVTFVIAALLLLRVPALEPAPGGERADGRGFGALTDVPYVVITALAGALVMLQGVLEIGLPLWVTHQTHAPRALISAAMLLNTVMVVLLQVRLSKGSDDPGRAARMALRAGTLIAVGCVLLGLSKGLPAWTATLLVLAAVAVMTVGEMLGAAGSWALGFDLADERAQGVYQGVFNTGFAAGLVLGPLAVTQTGLRFGLTGWLVLGGIFLATAVAFVPATRWAVATRPSVMGRPSTATGPAA
ncbi:MFS transporter [Actinomadura oligospora]|uniref:MFS transporter n=1 Tax=Actinomadura oligospora TaxID=111804 RepID=UPI0006840342|nr:MFS transporter [Actinomadura oligospora]